MIVRRSKAVGAPKSAELVIQCSNKTVVQTHYAIASAAKDWRLEVEGKAILEVVEVVILRKDGMSSKCCGRAGI